MHWPGIPQTVALANVPAPLTSACPFDWSCIYPGSITPPRVTVIGKWSGRDGRIAVGSSPHVKTDAFRFVVDTVESKAMVTVLSLSV